MIKKITEKNFFLCIFPGHSNRKIENRINDAIEKQHKKDKIRQRNFSENFIYLRSIYMISF